MAHEFIVIFLFYTRIHCNISFLFFLLFFVQRGVRLHAVCFFFLKFTAISLKRYHRYFKACHGQFSTYSQKMFYPSRGDKRA